MKKDISKNTNTSEVIKKKDRAVSPSGEVIKAKSQEISKDKEQNKTVRKDKKSNDDNRDYKTKGRNNLRNLSGPLQIMYALKNGFVGKRYAGKKSEIAQKLSTLIDEASEKEAVSQRTVVRDLPKISTIFDDDSPEYKAMPEDERNITATILKNLLGGSLKIIPDEKSATRIKAAERKKANPESDPKKERSVNAANDKYYIKPLITANDMLLIVNLIISTPYVSADTKKRVLENLCFLFPAYFSIIAPKQYSLLKNDKSESLPGSLNNHIFTSMAIPTIYDAIRHGLMLSISYGKYSLALGDDQKQHLVFEKKHIETQTINPYAMFFHNNKLYLVATHKGHEDICHYRVDRILEVKPIETQSSSASEIIYIQREPIPQSLYKYFNPKNKSFLTEKYTHGFPYMMYNNQLKNTTGTSTTNIRSSSQVIHFLEFDFCTSSELQTLIDFFGNEIDISNSKAKNHYKVIVNDVDYTNAKHFAMANTHITVIAPASLVQDLAQEFSVQAAKYKDMLNTTKAKANTSSMAKVKVPKGTP